MEEYINRINGTKDLVHENLNLLGNKSTMRKCVNIIYNYVDKHLKDDIINSLVDGLIHLDMSFRGALDINVTSELLDKLINECIQEGHKDSFSNIMERKVNISILEDAIEYIIEKNLFEGFFDELEEGTKIEILSIESSMHSTTIGTDVSDSRSTEYNISIKFTFSLGESALLEVVHKYVNSIFKGEGND